MKQTIREWMPLAVSVAVVVVPLVMFGLHWRWFPPITGYPLPIPWPC
jgi:hypothetical protein